MSSPGRFHLARKTPAMTLIDFEAKVDGIQPLSNFYFEEELLN